MNYRETDFLNLVARATPLHQRRHPHIEGCGGEAAAQARLEYWRRLLSSDDDRRLLARRLELDSLDEETCRLALGSVRIAAGRPLPAWAERLRTMLDEIAPPESTVPHPSSAFIGRDDAWALPIADEARESVPFWDLWLPFVTAATRELRERSGVRLENLGELALCTFQSQLLANLAYIGARSLGLEFRRFVARRNPLSLVGTGSDSTASRELYDRFLHDMLTISVLGFFHKYPVLARFVATVTGFWIDQVEEFCARLEADRSEIALAFNEGRDPGAVVALKTGASDPHHGRRAVLCATFESGLKLVYKPKDLAVDEAFWTFIGWLNTNGKDHGLLPLRTTTVLNRGTHGWVEFIEHAPCNDASQIDRYYRRIGSLLCVAYVLGGTDFHQENIIANGEQPVLLDFETMLQPLPRPWDGLRAGSADERALEAMHDSVIRTGLLPFWIVGDPGTSYDVSGIGAEDGAETGYHTADWNDINSDRMQLVYSASKTAPHARPMLGTRTVSAAGHVTDMLEGFSGTYRTLLAHRDSLLSAAGPLSSFRGLRLRCLLRMTKAYGQLYNRRLHPEFLRDAADSGLELERLSLDLVTASPNPECPVPWGVYGAEVEALERLDIPYFGMLSDSADLFADGKVVVRDFFPETGLERVQATLRRLSEQDLRKQTDLMRASLHARYAAPAALPTTRTDSTQVEPFNGEEWIEAAAEIAAGIRDAAIRGGDGSMTWLSIAFDPIANRMNLLPMTDNLYDGRLGVALFLAALEHATGGAGFRETALAALLPLRKQLRVALAPQNTRMILGGASGLGGQIYTLVRTAQWLGDEELLQLALKASRWFAPRRIASDDTFDVFGGAAGGILGLLALSASGGNGVAAERALECGKHLLKKRAPSASGHLAWQSSRMPQPLTGFGHGAAGIAYALLQLSRATGDDSFRNAAEEAIGFESAVYAAQAGNWPDFREGAGQGERFMVAWCNGAAGIGLGRLGGLDVLDNEGIRADIDSALRTTLCKLHGDDDHICCGNLGRVDLLIEAGRRLGRPDLLEAARAAATVLVGRARVRGRYGLYAQVPSVTDSVSLFQGTAGIGYELLRLAAPDRIPSVLLWS